MWEELLKEIYKEYMSSSEKQILPSSALIWDSVEHSDGSDSTVWHSKPDKIIQTTILYKDENLCNHITQNVSYEVVNLCNT